MIKEIRKVKRGVTISNLHRRIFFTSYQIELEISMSCEIANSSLIIEYLLTQDSKTFHTNLLVIHLP